MVAGTLGGRRIAAPPGRETRPTTDRVREAVFNALGSLGVVAGAEVLDLYAGTGALGIEALSRGANRCTFVERDRRVLAVLAENLRTLGVADVADVRSAAVDVAFAGLDGPFDLVLADPPYDFDDWPTLLVAVAPLLAPDAVVVVESDRTPVLPDGWEIVRERAYGGTVVVFARPADAPHPSGDTSGADA